MKVLSTPWSQKMGLQIPVLNAPMGGVAGGHLAAAVSAADGLGMIGVGSAGSVALLEQETEVPRRAQLPFGIGLLDEAREAEAAGIHVLVARGSEGGGHGDPKVGTLPLVTAVLDAVSLPVLAAGGVASARGLAAVLAAGASGAWIGTAFSACPESLTPPAARDALLRASETDTITTSVYDIALGYPWPSRFPERVLRSDALVEWTRHEDELATNPKARAAVANAVARGGERGIHVNAGQGVAELSEVHSVAEIMERLRTGAIALLGNWATFAVGTVGGELPQ
jgi:nitronate monooxygenase